MDGQIYYSIHYIATAVWITRVYDEYTIFSTILSAL